MYDGREVEVAPLCACSRRDDLSPVPQVFRLRVRPTGTDVPTGKKTSHSLKKYAVLRILIPHLLLDRCPVLHSSAATRICVTPPILPQQVLWLARWRLWSPHGGWPTNAAGLTTDPCFLPHRQCPGGDDYWLDRCFFFSFFFIFIKPHWCKQSFHTVQISLMLNTSKHVSW